VELAAMLGGLPAAGDQLVTNGGLVAVGPGGPIVDDLGELDLDTAEPGDLAPVQPIGSLGASALASARELLDAAESWRGRPVVPV
jgi:hypothetical protein